MSDEATKSVAADLIAREERRIEAKKLRDLEAKRQAEQPWRAAEKRISPPQNTR